jgi:ABC-type Fe3+-hydroxamate transport system substrate-binding protein
MPARRRRKNRLIGFNLLTLILIAGVAALVIFALRQCGPAAAPPAPSPVQPVSQPAGQTRIITLSPALAIILRDLGFDDLIVGRDAHDMVLDKSLPVCGDQTALDYEAILQVKPTHIFLQAGASPIPPRLTKMAAEHGWILKAYPLLTLDDITSAASDFHFTLVQVPSTPLQMMLTFQQAWKRRGDGFAAAGRVLLLESLDPPAAFGPGSFHQQVLERIGGTPAITEGKPFITMDAEDVLRLAPDAIIIFGSSKAAGSPTPEQIRTMMGRLGTLDIPAVKSGRLALISDPLALTPSTAMIGVADTMAAILEGWSTGR